MMGAADALSQLYALRMLPIPESEEMTMDEMNLKDSDGPESAVKQDGAEGKQEVHSVESEPRNSC